MRGTLLTSCRWDGCSICAASCTERRSRAGASGRSGTGPAPDSGRRRTGLMPVTGYMFGRISDAVWRAESFVDSAVDVAASFVVSRTAAPAEEAIRAARAIRTLFSDLLPNDLQAG